MCTAKLLQRNEAHKRNEKFEGPIYRSRFRIRIIICIALYSATQTLARKKVWLLFIWISFSVAKNEASHFTIILVRLCCTLLFHSFRSYSPFFNGLMQLFARLCKLCAVTANLAPYYMNGNMRIKTITIFIKFIVILCALIYDRCDDFFALLLLLLNRGTVNCDCCK